jgi:hypothetical protein
MDESRISPVRTRGTHVSVIGWFWQGRDLLRENPHLSAHLKGGRTGGVSAGKRSVSDPDDFARLRFALQPGHEGAGEF